MAEVIRVFGRADSFDIEFTKNGDKWEVDIPPDMIDGVYAVQLTAIDKSGVHAYWVGELYMTNGVCCLSLKSSLYKVNIEYNRYSIHISNKNYETLWQSSSKYSADNRAHYNMQITKSNEYYKSYHTSEIIKSLDSSDIVVSLGVQITKNDITMDITKNLDIWYSTGIKISIEKECRHGN